MARHQFERAGGPFFYPILGFEVETGDIIEFPYQLDRYWVPAPDESPVTKVAPVPMPASYVSPADGDVLTYDGDSNRPEWRQASSLTVTKANLGLANVDNTSDVAKPVSTATQTALDGLAASLTTAYQAADVDSATTLTAAISDRVPKPDADLDGKLTIWDQATETLLDGSGVVQQLGNGLFAPSDFSVTDDKVADDAAINLDKTVDGSSRLALTPTERNQLVSFGSVTGTLLQSGESNVPRVDASAKVTLTSGVLKLGYFPALRSATITKVRVGVIDAAAATPTLGKLAVFAVDPTSGDLNLVAVTANDTALFSNAGQAERTLLAPFDKVAGTWYAVGALCVTASAAPTIAGIGIGVAAEAGVAPRICGAATGQTDIPTTVVTASVSDSADLIYMALKQ